MPFLLAEILNFQGSTHHIGVGSFSQLFFIFFFLENLLIKSYNDYKRNNTQNQFKYILLPRKELPHHERNKRYYHRYDELP